MKKIALKIVLVVALQFVVAGVGVALALFLFYDEQSTGGAVGMATAEDIDLYICEPNGTPGPDCGSDDDGGTGDMANEGVWETDEDLTPGDVAQWDIRLQNVGSDAWDTASLIVTITETADPGGDCDPVPAVEAKILGKAGDEDNDNHWVSIPPNPCPYSEGKFPTNFLGRCHYVHVEPGDYDDMHLHAVTSSGWGNECVDNAWSIDLDWTVVNE